MAGRFHSLGVIMHDMAHQPIRVKTFKIRVLELMAGLPLFTTIEAMAYHHNRHHRHTNTSKDPYFGQSKAIGPKRKALLSLIKGPLLVTVWFIRPFIALLALVKPSLKTAYARIFMQDISGKDLTNSKEVARCVREDMGSLVFNLIVISAMTLYSELVFFYLIPVYVAGIFCVYRLLIEHEYEAFPKTNKKMLLQCTFDHHTKWYDRLFLAPRNIGYHIAHHLHPTVSYRELPEIQEFYEGVKA
jgi:fatty acid desaturase